MQEYSGWNVTFLTPINQNTYIVRDNVTGMIMQHRVSDPENYQVMRVLTGIRHPNLMTVYDARIINGKCVSLCEFINGCTLEQRVENSGVCGVDEAKRIICQLCDGLTALHLNGVIHRDVKPSNVMLTPDGKVKLIDYDISRLQKPAAQRDTTLMGTEGYAPPEQFGFAQTNARADVYSCGVLLNYLLTGKLPNETLYQGEVTEIIRECTAIDEAKRFENAEELKLVLLGKRKSKLRKKRALPGYRGSAGLKVLTTFIIVIWALLVLMCARFLANNFTEHPELFWGQLVICADVLIFWSALPYLLFGDAFTLSEMLNRKNPHNGLFVLRTLGIISIVLGFVLLYIALAASIS